MDVASSVCSTTNAKNFAEYFKKLKMTPKKPASISSAIEDIV